MKTKTNDKRNNKKLPPIHRQRKPETAVRFTPYAWAKLQWFCHRGESEVGGFGITDPEDLLLVTDFVTVKQDATVASVSFDDEAVADFFETQVDAGRQPEQFARIWLHTHPGDSPHPSGVDEETFSRVFGRCEWAVMFILAEGGKTYARLRFNVGPGGHAVIPVYVDYSRAFQASDQDAWETEYLANIHTNAILQKHYGSALDDLEVMDPRWFNKFELEDCDELELQAMSLDPEGYIEMLDESEVIE